jgi:cytochrome c-type biogenesis protein CcmF
MTRSGVFNSVHSFTQSDIGPVFLGFLAIWLVYSVVLLSTRGHLLEANGPKVKATSLFHPLGREFSILVQNVLFTVFTFTVLLGTTYPLVAEALDGRRVSVGEPYFERWALPLGVMIVFLMGVGPALPWGKVAPKAVLGRVAPPLVGGIFVTALGAVAGFTGPLTLLALFVCGYALVANGTEVLHPIAARIRLGKESAPMATITAISRTRRRFGAHVSHFGIVMAVVAIALSKGYKVSEDHTLAAGQTIEFQGYNVTFTGSRLDKQPHRDSDVATFVVLRNERDLGTVEPRLNQYHTMREPIGTPAILSSASDDLYMSLLELPRDGSQVTVRIMKVPGVMWLWVAGFMVALGALICALPSGVRKPDHLETAA